MANKTRQSLRLARPFVALAACLLLLALVATCSAASEFGPLPPANPYTAANGAATMHADSESSNASPFPGPGTGTQVAVPNELAAACPTLLQGSDGMPVALCTSIAGRNPVVYLLDPATGATLASLSLPAGNLFAGVYAYMDQENRVVLFNAEGDLLRIAHHASAGSWSLSIDSSTPAAAAIDARCPSLCGGVVGIAPDWHGRVWFVTAGGGVAGYVEPESGAVKTIVLGSGEQVANSISTAPEGTAIATDHALYLLTAKKKGAKVLWSYAYERGPARKPGQLSHGSGSTPTFFGPEDGTRYLTILDNASPAEHLLVFDTWARFHFHRRTGAYTYKLAKTPQLACDLPALTPGPSGSENNPVGSGRSVFVASTYGYPYPSLPAGAEPSEPETAPFSGGVERIDLDPGSGCTPHWQDEVHSAAVPRLDVANGILYTVQDSDPLEPNGTGLTDSYAEDAIDAATGQVLHQTLLGATYAFNTLQLAPTIVPGEVMYQGTVTGILRIAPVRG